MQPLNSYLKFLVDSGSVISLVPVNSYKKIDSCSQTLRAANGTNIKSYGKTKLKLNLNGKEYDWVFTVADVTRPILGADFLSFYDLLVDCKREQIWNPEDNT